jgi:hypothetical protein
LRGTSLQVQPRIATNGLRTVGIFAIEKKIGLKVDVVIRYIGTST